MRLKLQIECGKIRIYIGLSERPCICSEKQIISIQREHWGDNHYGYEISRLEFLLKYKSEEITLSSFSGGKAVPG